MESKHIGTAQHEVAYAGSYPDTFDAEADGQWFVLTASNNPIGVVWANTASGFGFIPADSVIAPNAPRAIDAFRVLSEVGGQQSLAAPVIYQAAKQLEGYGVSQESSGQLQGAIDAYNAIAAQTVTASGVGALPDGERAVGAGNSLAATVDVEGDVLELIYSNVDGIYVRDSGTWTLVDTNTDQPTIDDQEWFDVTLEFVPVFDNLLLTQDSVTRDDVVPYGSSPA